MASLVYHKGRWVLLHIRWQMASFAYQVADGLFRISGDRWLLSHIRRQMASLAYQRDRWLLSLIRRQIASLAYQRDRWLLSHIRRQMVSLTYREADRFSRISVGRWLLSHIRRQMASLAYQEADGPFGEAGNVRWPWENMTGLKHSSMNIAKYFADSTFKLWLCFILSRTKVRHYMFQLENMLVF